MDFAVPKRLNRDDIKSFRRKYNLTQQDLAHLFNVSKKTVEKWESKDGVISQSACTTFLLLYENPKLVEQLKIPKKKYKYRYYYMAENTISTIIDVDYAKQNVEFKNFTNNINRKAFGSKKEVTYEEFLDFLESRCFPRTRDNLKLILRELELPFYDPILIVEKTEGRMADDNYWLKIEVD